MKILKDRRIAILITIIVVVLATLLGVRGSLVRLSRDAERMFYDGVNLKEEGYTQPGIDSQLRNRMNSALGFASLMEKHPELEGAAGALLSARRELLDANSIKGMYSANESMQRAFVELLEKAEKFGLSNKEREDMERYSATFQGAQTAIRNSHYNQRAQSFMGDASILARLMKPFLFVPGPQVFG